ncbi:MAG: hypothetical protein AAGU11_07495, partial [Syntrophobacteraceae bacterium]
LSPAAIPILFSISDVDLPSRAVVLNYAPACSGWFHPGLDPRPSIPSFETQGYHLFNRKLKGHIRRKSKI